MYILCEMVCIVGLIRIMYFYKVLQMFVVCCLFASLVVLCSELLRFCTGMGSLWPVRVSCICFSAEKPL